MTRPDRPPGRNAEGGPPTQRDRLHITSTPSPPGVEVVSSVSRGAGSGLDDLFDLSNERDQWERRVLAAWREGYQAALSDAVVESLLRIWPEPGHVPEIEKRRYPPGGRLSWIIPRPGDAAGGQR